MPDKVCPRCEGSTGLPHSSDTDCFRELDREIAQVVRQLRTLTKRKGQLLRDRIRARQKTIVRNGNEAIVPRTPLAGVFGPKGRRVAPLAARKFGRKA